MANIEKNRQGPQEKAGQGLDEVGRGGGVMMVWEFGFFFLNLEGQWDSYTVLYR